MRHGSIPPYLCCAQVSRRFTCNGMITVYGSASLSALDSDSNPRWYFDEMIFRASACGHFDLTSRSKANIQNHADFSTGVAFVSNAKGLRAVRDGSTQRIGRCCTVGLVA